jgi:hypothetical protein
MRPLALLPLVLLGCGEPAEHPEYGRIPVAIVEGDHGAIAMDMDTRGVEMPSLSRELADPYAETPDGKLWRYTDGKWEEVR